MMHDRQNTDNDAHQTTTKIQTDIVQHLTIHIPRNNITILESPPLLDSSSSDIFPYNNNSCSLAQQLGISFAGTLIGEQHIWGGDGYHILKNSRSLLLKSVAAAAVGINPRRHFRLARPLFGIYGPWVAPKDRGILPSFRDQAMAQPLVYRRLNPIRPLMNDFIRRP